VAAVRAGQGLLTGLLRCGRCGRKLHVRYWGKSGTAARYLCPGDYAAGGRYCQAFGGSTVDKRFGAEVLDALSPLGMEVSLRALTRTSSEGDERRQALARQLEQLTYEAARAFEQYDEVDPRNRLVASELERRWNAKLEEVERVREAMEEPDPCVRGLPGQAEEEDPPNRDRGSDRRSGRLHGDALVRHPLEGRGPYAFRDAQAAVRSRSQDVDG
jgi:hypothetical protein